MTGPSPHTYRGVYPGTFNPPTIGHLAIIEAAFEHLNLTSLDLVISLDPLAKTVTQHPTIDHRIQVIEASVAHLDAIEVYTTPLRLIADIARGYDVVVMGADKWAQVNDVAFYESAEHRDTMVASLPRLAVAARRDFGVPDELLLPTEHRVHRVSSTDARSGNQAIMTEAAREFDVAWGAWSDPRRYEQSIATAEN